MVHLFIRTYTSLMLLSPRMREKTRPVSQHWWSEDIATLHRAAHDKRRALKRARRRRGSDTAAAEEAAAEYRRASKALWKAIAAVKARAWDELLLTLDENPWGRPYHIVRNKLRRWVPPHTESLEASLLDRILGALFPQSTGEVSPWEEKPPNEGEWSEDLEVSEEKLNGEKGMRRQEDAGEEYRPRSQWRPR